MELELPKWLVKELSKDTDKSIQYIIKEILKEYVRGEEGRKIRERIIEKERVRGMERY